MQFPFRAPVNITVLCECQHKDLLLLTSQAASESATGAQVYLATFYYMHVNVYHSILMMLLNCLVKLVDHPKLFSRSVSSLLHILL